jgi:hypothetical protein
MQTYSCFIRDRRYAVPTLRLIDAADDDAARRSALDELAASQDHLGVELHSETGLILKRERRSFSAERTAAPEA